MPSDVIFFSSRIDLARCTSRYLRWESGYEGDCFNKDVSKFCQHMTWQQRVRGGG